MFKNIPHCPQIDKTTIKTLEIQGVDKQSYISSATTTTTSTKMARISALVFALGALLPYQVSIVLYCPRDIK